MSQPPASSSSPSVPDVYIDATSEDGPLLRPLAGELRQRGLTVEHAEDGLLAAGRSIEAARERIRTGRVVVVPVGSLQRALGRVDWVRHAFETSAARIVGVRLHESDERPAARIDELLDLRTFGDLRGASDAIARWVKGGAENESGASIGSESGSRPRGAQAALHLRLGNEAHDEHWNVRATLHDAVLYAARIGARAEIPVSFKTLLLSLFNTAGRWSIWSRETGASSGFQAEQVFAEQRVTREQVAERMRAPLTAGERDATARVTTSVAAILRSAREHARRAVSPLDVEHVIAALVHDPAGHEEDLARWGFQPRAWSEALTREIAARLPHEERYFRELHAARFGAPEPNAPAQEQRQDSKSPHLLESWEATFWSEASAEVRTMLSLAAKLAARDDARAQLTPLHVLAGVLATDRALAEAWNRALPPRPEHAPLGVEGAALAALGFEGSEREVEPLEELPELDAHARAALGAARERSSRAMKTTDVFVELWAPAEAETAPLDGLLGARGIDAEGALRALCTDVRLGFVAQALQRVLDRRAAAAWSRPGVHNDQVGASVPFERDRLDVGPAAKRLAKLLADKSVKPPLAVGLFGNWGSGKTFFMGLMRSHVNHLTGTRARGYARRVVQIEFNAWNYHDTNLWASLAIHIFDSLAHELSEKTESSIEATRRKLHERMSSSKAHRKEAQEQRDQAVARRAAAAQTLEAKRRERAEKVKRSVAQRFELAWETVRSGESFAALRASTDALAEHFGVVALDESVQSVQALRADVEKTRAHAFGLFTAIGQRFRDTPRGVTTVTFLLGAALLALAFGWGAEWVLRELQMHAPQYSGTVIEVATMISVVVAWCGRRVKQLQSGLDVVSRLEADVAAAEKTLDVSKNRDLIQLEQEISALDEAIVDADGQIAAADQEIVAAQAEIDRINRGGLVYDFLQQRRTATAYVSQLGLVSTIRRDLQDLDALLDDFAGHAQNPIERILLYIDDLDRCHPDKVLEVLQAVHLLLTFDLFNVVVGVDARWLERSLRRQYEQKLGGRSLAADGFSPQDYLEKIFQIPYALGGMNPKGFREFVGDMIPTRAKWLVRKEKEDRKREMERQDALRRRAEEEQRVRNRESADTTAGAAPGVDAQPVDGTPVEVPPSGDEHAALSNEPDGERIHAEAPGLSEDVPQYIEEHEAKFIDELYPFIDRPRLAKRFVNIYKLLRVTADDEGLRATFAHEPTAEAYRAALVLLAIHIGHHRLSLRLVPAILAAAKSDTWSGVLERLDVVDRASARWTSDELEELAQVRAKLARLPAPVPQALEAYKEWAPHVLRYSFEPLRPRAQIATTEHENRGIEQVDRASKERAAKETVA